MDSKKPIDASKQGQSLAFSLQQEIVRPINTFIRRESISRERISALRVEKSVESGTMFSRPSGPRFRAASESHIAASKRQ